MNITACNAVSPPHDSLRISTPLAIELSGHAAVDDPYAFYTRVREAGRVTPVLINQQPLLAISHYRDVQAALCDSRFSREAVSIDDSASLYQKLILMHSMMERDPPVHTRLRKGACSPFRQQPVMALRTRFDQAIMDLLDALPDNSLTDVDTQLAVPAARAMLSAFLDMPLSRFRDVAEQMHDPRPVVRLRALICLAIRTRRAKRQFGDDVLGQLLEARAQGQFENDDEVVSTLLLIIRAGQHTTAKTIANALALLATRPEAVDHLKANPAAVSSAIEEILRFESPVQATYRWAREDMEFAGQAITQGSGVWLVIGSANRDPDYFQSPSTLLVDRTPNRHVAMGSGHHLCLGAPVARLFLQRFLFHFVARTSSLQLDSPEALRWLQGDVFRSVAPFRLRTS